MPTAQEIEEARLEEAAMWLARLESGRGGEEAFERWRTDPANALAYIRVSQTADWVEKNLSTPAVQPDSDLAVVKPRRRAWITGAAASLIVVASGAGGYAMMAQRAVARTAVGERSSLSLPDGGRVDINTDSEVFWKFGRRARDVWLERGEVALLVARDSRPLVVHAGPTRLELSAGQYNVRRTEAGLQVAVLSGAGVINSAASGGARQVQSGEIAMIGRANIKSGTMPPATADAISAWKNDELVLDGMALSEAVREYNRYLKAKLIVTDPALEGLKLGGRFDTKDPSEFITALKTSFEVRVRNDAEGNVLLGG
ncbi:FecR family protein [Asticcacaulis sp. W401b]|uniref:FecR family protein n=1 Tax=Asticcacaulis sp. W401b TaxID=3388666 RepID=UPI0039708438